MNLVEHAKRELDLIGMTAEADSDNNEIRQNILDCITTFAKYGHSGSTAEYTIGVLERLLRFRNLGPLTGIDSEWNDVSYTGGGDGSPLWQNNRDGEVFKDTVGAYHIYGERREYITFPFVGKTV